MTEKGVGVVSAVLFVAVIYGGNFAACSNVSEIQKVTEIVESLLDGYNKIIRPSYGASPILVNISLLAYSVGPVLESDMTFTIDIYFRQIWRDERLNFEAKGNQTLNLNAEFFDKIWVPDTYFNNEKNAYYHTIVNKNSLVRITPKGDVFSSTRITLKTSCPMNLRLFPMDKQRCSIGLASYAYSTEDIDYRWVGDYPVSMLEGIELPQFLILGYNNRRTVIVYSVGNYTELYADFYLGRQISYYLIQTYGPAILIVMLSWLSFWINRGATPARVALGITTVLTMTTLIGSANASLPKISYIKSIDLFLCVSYLFVFGSLMEYATVSYFNKPRYRDARQEKKDKKKRRILNDKDSTKKQNNKDANLEKETLRQKDVALRSFKRIESEGMGLDSEESGECEIQYYPVDGADDDMDVRQIQYIADGKQMGTGTSHQRRIINNYTVIDIDKEDMQMQRNQACQTPSGGISEAKGGNSCLSCLTRVKRRLIEAKKNGLDARQIDKYCRAFFPLFYIIFNIFYWGYYLTVSDVSLEEMIAKDVAAFQ